MKLLSKYKAKIQRQMLKRDSEILVRLIERHHLNLYIKDKDNILFDLEPNKGGLRHLIKEKSYLDGTVGNAIKEVGSNLKEKGIAIDVGANFGLCSILMSRFSKKVYAFEPEAKNILRLKDLLLVNGVNNVEVISKAVSDKVGQSQFYLANNSTHHSLGKAHESLNANHTGIVDTITLDSFCAENGIDRISCIKIDVEGFEKEVLLGAKELLKNKKIDNIIFEVSMGVMSRLKRNPLDVVALLEDNGFIIKDTRGMAITRNTDSSLFLDQDLIASLAPH